MELKKNYSEQAELLIFRKSSPSLGILPPAPGAGLSGGGRTLPRCLALAGSRLYFYITSVGRAHIFRHSLGSKHRALAGPS